MAESTENRASAARRGRGTQVIRRGRQGMPAYGPDVLTDAQLSDLVAFMSTLGSR